MKEDVVESNDRDDKKDWTINERGQDLCIKEAIMRVVVSRRLSSCLKETYQIVKLFQCKFLLTLGIQQV